MVRLIKPNASVVKFSTMPKKSTETVLFANGKGIVIVSLPIVILVSETNIIG